MGNELAVVVKDANLEWRVFYFHFERSRFQGFSAGRVMDARRTLERRKCMGQNHKRALGRKRAVYGVAKADHRGRENRDTKTRRTDCHFHAVGQRLHGVDVIQQYWLRLRAGCEKDEEQGSEKKSSHKVDEFFAE